MKVALLLSGHFRNANSCFFSIREKILDRFDTDVFISTWNPGGDFTNYIPVPTRDIPDAITFDQVINLYKPKSILSEDFDSVKIKKLIDKAWELDPHGPMNGETNSASILCMWHKIHSSFKIMENYESSAGFRYDFIIKGRFDINIHDPIDLEIDKGSVKIPPGFDWRGGFNDIFAWGGREEMGYYCSLYEKIEEYVKTRGVFFHPETMLKYHLIQSPFGVTRPDLRVSLRDKNVWEYQCLPDNHKKNHDI
jgi:hypothetical protein